MARSQKSYSRDEFDSYVGLANGGAHRGKKTVFARVRPYIIAIVVAVVAALCVWLVYTGAFNQTPSSSNTTVQSAAKSKTVSSAKKSSTSSKTTSDEDAEQQDASKSSQEKDESADTHSAAVDRTLQITVFNGNNIAGFASQKAAVLTNAGYTSVSASNPSNRNALPVQATVWYVNDTDEATAQDVAKVLGIANVEKVASLTSGSIAVIAK